MLAKDTNGIYQERNSVNNIRKIIQDRLSNPEKSENEAIWGYLLVSLDECEYLRKLSDLCDIYIKHLESNKLAILYSAKIIREKIDILLEARGYIDDNNLTPVDRFTGFMACFNKNRVTLEKHADSGTVIFVNTLLFIGSFIFSIMPKFFPPAVVALLPFQRFIKKTSIKSIDKIVEILDEAFQHKKNINDSKAIERLVTQFGSYLSDLESIAIESEHDPLINRQIIQRKEGAVKLLLDVLRDENSYNTIEDKLLAFRKVFFKQKPILESDRDNIGNLFLRASDLIAEIPHAISNIRGLGKKIDLENLAEFDSVLRSGSKSSLIS